MSETLSSPPEPKRERSSSTSLQESNDISAFLSEELTNNEIFLTIAPPPSKEKGHDETGGNNKESVKDTTSQTIEEIKSADLQDILQDIIDTKSSNKLNLWRGAVKCRLLLGDLQSSPDADKLPNILYYWLIRLYLLARLDAPTVFQQESRRLLEIITPHQQRLFLHLSSANKDSSNSGLDYEEVLWSLQLLLAQLSTRPSNDLQGLIARYYRLGTECRRQLHLLSTSSTPSNHEKDMIVIWKRRLFSLGIQIALVLLEMKDYTTVMQHLLSLRRNLSDQSKTQENTEYKQYTSTWLYQLDGLIITVYLQVGDVSNASQWLHAEFGQYPSGPPSYIDNGNLIEIKQEVVDFEKVQFEALCLIADGEWQKAHHLLKSTAAGKDDGEVPNTNKYYRQLTKACELNLSVSSLYDGNLQESIRILEDILAHDTTRSNAAHNVFTEIIKLTPNMVKSVK